ncbi:unnamed protein product [Pseudo-nitzschia multistriata]|uniref:ABC1 atypical kinase-like domain-containing protein n=1 Tax=Pseudo-nitzschia multistriata TaxID=183589 RepID=A0A448ZAJ0_9STRA|nr:unnamed protein product [Pseudo-nitzschia multistriata]
MAMSRIFPLVLTHRRLPTLMGTGAVLASSGFMMVHSTTTKTQCTETNELLLKPTESPSLLIPTAEASLRAMRLISTAFRIILDYQVAKVETHMPFSSLNKEECEIKELEAEIERRELKLEELQIEYSRGTGSNEATRKLSVEERIELQNKQKTQIQEAAAELAAVEEKWMTREDLSSKSRLNRKSAERLLNLCRENGGVYIKVGQHLANLDYLIPREYIEVLSSLFNDAPQSDINDVYSVIEEDLGHKAEDLFDDFDPIPIASASLAQVHVAYCKKTKKKLAVKVQHRGLRETSAGDLFAVTRVVRAIDSLFTDFTFGWIADEMAPLLPKELDFQREGRNSEQAAADVRKSGLACCIPKVVWERTSPRVLTMEFEEGFKSTDIEALKDSGLNKSDVAKLVSSVFNSQVFHSGFVHCDPHPGNCLIRRSKNGRPEMVLVDHGLYKRLDDDFRIKYAELWRSLMMADLEGIKSACSGMGVNKMYPLFAAMLTARPYDEIIERSKTGSLSARTHGGSSHEVGSQADRAVIRGYAKQFLGEIFSLLGVLPPQMLLLLKMNDCLRHIDMTLESPTNTLVIAGKYAASAVYREQMRRTSSSNNEFSLAKRSILRFRYWLEYTKVMFRIQIHDVGAWILSKYYSCLNY